MIQSALVHAVALTASLAVGIVAAAAVPQHAGSATAAPSVGQDPPPKEHHEPGQHGEHSAAPDEQGAHRPAGQPPPPEPEPTPVGDHSGHTAPTQTVVEEPKDPVPPLTDADRAAAFPPNLSGHAVHDRTINYMVLFDQVEWQGPSTGGANWENTSWVGGDLSRLWLRTEGESDGGRLDSLFVDALWGRPFSRWWDFVAGVRQDFRPGDPQTWVGAGVQGLAPYWFEIEATGYVGGSGRTHARVEVEYELLLTNRLILQPLVELEMYGQSDPERGIGAGISTLESGLRLRYELRREFAPYIGITWDRKFFKTADFARSEGEKVGETRLAVGVRFWF